MLSIGLLGALEVVRDGGPVRLVGKPAALLVALVLRRNEVVTVDRLLDDLWGERVPRSGRKLLQAYVLQLRRAIGRDRVRTSAGGYLLAADEREVDLARFELLLRDAQRAQADGDAPRADALLAEALGLWRGTPLADLADMPFAAAAAARLDELRLHAVEARIDARLALGAHSELVPELEALAAEHPLRERLRGQLMLALYRSGRQADALARFRQGRDVLVRTLGLEPAPDLRRLEEAILRQDPALEATRVPEPVRSLLVDGDDEAGLALFGPVARERGRELLLLRTVADLADLADATAALAARRDALAAEGIDARVAAFRTDAPLGEVARFASRPGIELAVVAIAPGELRRPASVAELLRNAACDLALIAEGGGPPGDGPVVVAFGGSDNDWAALEVAVALAEAHAKPLVLAGAARGKEDPSRILAAASLAVQRVARIVAEPLVIAPGEERLRATAMGATALLVGVPDDWRRRGLGEARVALAAAAPAPTLLVRRGVRTGVLTPDESLTRFTWSA